MAMLNLLLSLSALLFLLTVTAALPLVLRDHRC